MAAQEELNSFGTEENPIVVKPERPFEAPVDLIHWQAPDRMFRNRAPVWFLSLLVLAGISFLVLILMQQWTLALVLISVVFVLATVNLVEPANHEYTLTTNGIKYGKRLYGFEDMKWFWFEDEESQTMLYVTTYLNFPHILEIGIPQEHKEQLISEIQQHMLKYLPYHEEKRRDVMRLLDRVILKMSPWLPKSMIDWYSTQFST